MVQLHLQGTRAVMRGEINKPAGLEVLTAETQWLGIIAFDWPLLRDRESTKNILKKKGKRKRERRKT